MLLQRFQKARMRVRKGRKVGRLLIDAQVSHVEIFRRQRRNDHVVQGYPVAPWQTQTKRLQSVIPVCVIIVVVWQIDFVPQREDAPILPCAGCIDIDQTTSGLSTRGRIIAQTTTLSRVGRNDPRFSDGR